MELFEFRGEDITEDEDGGIIRRIITKGQGYSKPNEGAAVEGNKVIRGCNFSLIVPFLRVKIRSMSIEIIHVKDLHRGFCFFKS